MNNSFKATFTMFDGTDFNVLIGAQSLQNAWKYAFHYASDFLTLSSLKSITVKIVTLKQDKN